MNYGVSKRKLRLAPYGVNLEKFHPCGSPPLDEFRVVFVGGACIRKGIRYLLESFWKLKHPRKHLTLAGTVSNEVLKNLTPLQHDANITILGHVPQAEIKKLLSVSHVMVLASIEEGLACVQAQALACGCPIIASQHTGADGDIFFEHGKEGFIVPIRNSEAIAERLQMLADCPDVRSAMSENALRRVKSVAGWNEYGSRMYAVFSELRS